MTNHDNQEAWDAVDVIRRVLSDTEPMIHARNMTEQSARSLWARLAGLGVVDLAASSATNQDVVDDRVMVALSRMMGEFLVPAPVVSAICAARLLARSGSEPASVLLDRMRDGALVQVEARSGTDSALGPNNSTTTLVWDPRIGVVAVTSHVAREGPYGRHGSAPNAPVVASGETGYVLWQRSRTDLALFTAAELAGIGTAGLGLGVEYAKSRLLFGRPVGSYQAPAHALAGCFVELAAVSSLIEELAESQEVSWTEARLAFVGAAQAACKATRVSLHVHGGYGFSLEYDIHLFLLKAKQLSLQYGSLGDVLAEVGRLSLADVKEGRL